MTTHVNARFTDEPFLRQTPTAEFNLVRQVSWLTGQCLPLSSQPFRVSDVLGDGSPFTVAGQLRYRTGFPLSFHQRWKNLDLPMST
jgi:hypothetical protein